MSIGTRLPTHTGPASPHFPEGIFGSQLEDLGSQVNPSLLRILCGWDASGSHGNVAMGVLKKTKDSMACLNMIGRLFRTVTTGKGTTAMGFGGKEASDHQEVSLGARLGQ